MAYRSFYVIAVFEIATNIAISSNWKAVTFKGTHLVQRMSLLTLIILGEGVMTIVQRITTVRLLLYLMNWDLTCCRSSQMRMHGMGRLLEPLLPLYPLL